MTVTDPGLEPFSVTVQLPVERMHFVVVNETDPVPSFDQTTLPVGVEPAPLTVALHLVAEPTTREAELQDMVSAVGGVTSPEVWTVNDT